MAERTDSKFTIEDHLQQLCTETTHLGEMVILAGIACSPAAEPRQQKVAVERLLQQLRLPIK